MRPVCVPCRRFFRCRKNDFWFIEGMPIGGSPEPGTSEPEKWRPYKVWAADLYECNGCGAQILSGFGRAPIAEHFELEFDTLVQRLNAAQLQVNDC